MKTPITKAFENFSDQYLALTFRGKILWYLKDYFKKGKLQFWNLQNQTQLEYFYQLKETLYHKQWVVYSKKNFNNEQSVFEYLGRYTHSPRWI